MKWPLLSRLRRALRAEHSVRLAVLFGSTVLRRAAEEEWAIHADARRAVAEAKARLSA